jgi:hypothetical protein
MEQVDDKRCRICEETKPRADFYAHSTSRDSLQAYCKECAKKKKKHYKTRKCRGCKSRKDSATFVSNDVFHVRCPPCAQAWHEKEAADRMAKEKRRAATLERKKLDFDRPRCKECLDRYPRADFGTRDNGRVAKVCNGCQEARDLTVEVARLAFRGPTCGTGVDPRPSSVAVLRERMARDELKNKRSFARLRAATSEALGR